MKFNIKFKYILFIIISFVFVMSDVRAVSTISLNNYDWATYPINTTNYKERYFEIYEVKQNNGYVESEYMVDVLRGAVSKGSDKKINAICYDACSDPGTTYTTSSDNSPLSQKMEYLISKNYSIKYSLAIAQMLGASNVQTHCNNFYVTSHYSNSDVKEPVAELLQNLAKYCLNYSYNDNTDYTKTTKVGNFYIKLGQSLEIGKLCNYYKDINNNYSKYSKKLSLKKPEFKTEIRKENGEEVTIYKINIYLNNPDVLYSSMYSDQTIPRAASVLPSEDKEKTWYSINNKNYKIISAKFNSGLEIELSKKGECEPFTLKIDDHGMLTGGGILLGKNGNNQYMAFVSSIFNTSVTWKCSNENTSSNSKCSVYTEEYNSKEDCPKITQYYKAKSAHGKKKTSVCDPSYVSPKATLISSNNFVASPFAIRQLGFNTTEDYVFSDFGAGCCDDYKNDANFKNSLLTELNPNQDVWDYYYKKWCTSEEQYCTYDPNSKSVFNDAYSIPYNGNGNPLLTASYAFESLGCCNDYKNGTRGFSAVKTDLNWQNAYKTYCDGTTTEVTTSTACINPAPNSQTIVDNKINNCCLDDTHSYVQEVQLNDLFDSTKTHEGVTYFEPLPTCEGSDLDVAKGNINKYCDFYCTERLDIEVPGSTSADSGRYFKFNEIDGHASPKVDGYRRCRVTIKYDDWYKDYDTVNSSLVRQFNDYQIKEADAVMYERATKVGTATDSYDVYCGWSETVPNGDLYCAEMHTVGSAAYVDCTHKTHQDPKEEKITRYATYEIYTFNSVAYKEAGVNDPNPNTNYSYSQTTRNTSVPTVTGYNSKRDPNDSSCPRGSKSRDTYSPRPDLNSIRQQKRSTANEYKRAYEEIFDSMENLQKDLNKCDRYLDDNYLYNLDPDVKFKYTQFFKNELGDPDSVITEVEYGDASCTTKRLDTANTKDKIEGPTYSPNPGYTGVSTVKYEKLGKNALLNVMPTLSPFNADMKFRYDKIYNTTCYWDNQSTYYTLVPSGASDIEKKADNYTVHDRVYKVLLTSYDGVYETYWELENLGHEGRLQQYFDNPTDTLKNKNNGENVNANTCSGLSESDADMLGLSSTFTCTFKVTHKAITTGRCNPDSGHDITLNGNSCDDKAEGYQLFYFKVADPSNLFPDGNGEYGKNWSTDMINKVQSTDTYNPANETYKFVLTQGDMKLIKEYNDSRESEGGYSDFDFSCTCTDACVNCKSKFLEDYYSGTFYSGSGTFTPAGKKLNEIREKYGW